VLFIRKQQVQPLLAMVIMQSQQAWIISQQVLSPLVQVTQQPVLVISTLHMPMVRLQPHTIMPFIMQQTEQVPPISIMHRFCIMVRPVESSQSHVIFMPPVTFSKRKVQRGVIIQVGGAGIDPVVVPVGIIGFVIIGRSIMAFMITP
jgi:hypothetical protein